MNTCKMCGAQVLSLVPKKGMEICSECAAKIDAEPEAYETAIIFFLKAIPLKTPAEINARLAEQGIKIANSTLYETLSRLVNHGRIKKSGPHYFVEASHCF
ncbi:MAG: hypothetical protein RBG13Loki_0045 [Promethearchaeota archaeon CR_4]|nr:MAG: hypothetical protein RBG13Loki_0045 [Candidatus Lokiarchaeota archaeon CR_4]